jgi:predicted ATPase
MAPFRPVVMRRLSIGRAHSWRTVHTRPLQQIYDDMVHTGALREDSSQRALSEQLQALREGLATHASHTAAYATELRAWHRSVESVRIRREERRAQEAALVTQLPAWRRALYQIVAPEELAPAERVMTQKSEHVNSELCVSSIPRKEPNLGPSAHRCAKDGPCSELGLPSSSSNTISPCGTTSGSTSGCNPVDSGLTAKTVEPNTLRPRGVSAPVRLGDLTEEERRHPFWAARLGEASAGDATPAPEGEVGAITEQGQGANMNGPVTDASIPRWRAQLCSLLLGRQNLPLDDEKHLHLPPPPPPPPGPPRGVFIHGDVGAGKTLLMDLFADALTADMAAHRAGSSAVHLRRVHFNSFILECHRRLHSHTGAWIATARARSREHPWDDQGALPAASATADGRAVEAFYGRGSTQSWDVLTQLVRRVLVEPSRPEHDANLHTALDSISDSILRGQIAGLQSDQAEDELLVADPNGRPVSAGVLCFDEVQMMDVADSAVVAGVLSRLFDAGWTLVATCNRAPEELSSSTLHQNFPQVHFLCALSARPLMLQLPRLDPCLA